MGSNFETDSSARDLEAFYGDDHPRLHLFDVHGQDSPNARRSVLIAPSQEASDSGSQQRPKHSPSALHRRRGVSEDLKQAMSPEPFGAGVTVLRLLRSFIREARRNGLALELVMFSDAVLLSWREHKGELGGGVTAGETNVSLKPREHSILTLIGRGHSNKAIARELCISTETVKWNIKHIFRKLHVESRLQAVSKAQSLGLLPGRQCLGTPRFATGALE
jgi:DNA-binding CsgD family transcriptional regulator